MCRVACVCRLVRFVCSCFVMSLYVCRVLCLIVLRAVFACRVGDTVLAVSCVVLLICLPWGGAVRVRVALCLFVLAMSCGGCVLLVFVRRGVVYRSGFVFLCLLCLVFMRCSLSFWPCRGRGAFLVLLVCDDIYRFEEC